MRYGPNTVFAAGMARPTAASPIAVQYDLLLVTFIFEKEDGRILEAEANMVCGVTSDYLCELMVGRSIYTDLPLIIEDIQTKYLGQSRRALVVCMKDAYAKICERGQALIEDFNRRQADHAKTAAAQANEKLAEL